MVNVWKFDEGRNKIYVEDESLKEKLLVLEGTHLHCKYYKKGRLKGWDMICPESQAPKIRKILTQKSISKTPKK